VHKENIFSKKKEKIMHRAVAQKKLLHRKWAQKKNFWQAKNPPPSSLF